LAETRKEGFSMALTENGISTTKGHGQFRYETYQTAFAPVKGITRVQWDYRDTKGVLHSGIAKSVEEARKAARVASGESV
jgi:hypothetical protein